MDANSPSKTFSGVRFVLFGFNAVEEDEVRSKLVAADGVEVGDINYNCTHLIVINTVYDDPLCVAARNDGKTVVTRLWVDHSFDIGMLVNTASVMYRPPRDRNGIPGAGSLVICLTGYQRQDREDIMTMVGLMGAQFSKPLVAYKVTHLICYKFEGEKYELARKTKKIKIVNHLWLEDCLRNWELLPEESYDKSGYELEMMEASAKDSEDEAEATAMNQSEGRCLNMTPQSLRNKTPVANRMPDVESKASVMQLMPSVLEGPINSITCTDLLTPGKDNMHYRGLNSRNIDHPTEKPVKEGGGFVDACSDHLHHLYKETSAHGRIEANLSSITKNTESSFHSSDAKLDALSYSRRLKSKFSVNADCSFKPGDSELINGVDSSAPNLEPRGDKNASIHLETPFKINESHNEVLPGLLHGRSVESLCTSSSKSQMASTKGSPPIICQTQGMKQGMLGKTNGFPMNNEDVANESCHDQLSSKFPGLDEKLANDNIGVLKNLSSESGLGEPSKKTSEDNLHPSGPLDVASKVKFPQDQEPSVVALPFASANAVMEKSGLTSNSDLLHGGKAKLVTEPSKTKTVAYKRALGSRAKSKNSSNQKGSILLSKSLLDDELGNCSTKSEIRAEAGSNNEMEMTKSLLDDDLGNCPTKLEIRAEVGSKNLMEISPSTDGAVAVPETMTKVVSGIDVTKNLESLDDETQAPDEKADNEQEQSLGKLMEVGEGEQKTEGKLSGERVQDDSSSTMPNDSVCMDNRRNENKPDMVVPGKRYNLVKGKKKNSKMADVLSVPTVKSKKVLAAYWSKGWKDTKKKEMSEIENSTGTDRKPGEECVKKHGPASGAMRTSSPGNVPNDTVSLDNNEPELADLVEDDYCVRGKKRNPKMVDLQTVPKMKEMKKSKKDSTELWGENGIDTKRKEMDEMGSGTGSHRMEGNSKEAEKECGRSAGGLDISRTENVRNDTVSSDNNEPEVTIPGQNFNFVQRRKGNSEMADVHTASKLKKMKMSKKDSVREGSETGKEMNEMKNSSGSGRMQRDIVEPEKENRISSGGLDNLSPRNVTSKDVVVKATKTLLTGSKKSRGSILKPTADRKALNNVTEEPRCFILSGHRFQRKEYQQVIKRLKGKCCRDSHQWSYEATHFIAPVLRRTEKFFAAAASGRWILKSDYLSACQQAGSLLPEEPYEWHKIGITEDGAINLEAPRKWRLLREKTGHGAFYKMRIIVYGDCIAPPLDTLKRVVKAGDGTILATSPPYTRFLNSHVDFAIVSPGVPRGDAWVQEFLNHEIPCVLADYLVEYVCKPEQPLYKHVLYDTHAWAEKSLASLQTRANECIEETSDDDIACEVCGSRDRWNVMLICGNESGSEGCGAGTHIDCCDPPLEEVPDGDWFCSRCSCGGKDARREKRSSQSKRK